ncbi:MAG: DUF4332 domain-containing protein [Actinobacteria bacterium]|nr:MAG: DUF4332 domain-containing protein [Actinomycetota bacterium]
MTAKENLERAAYTAVGAPVAGAKALKAKAEKLAETVRETRRELRSDALSEFDEWVAEGEMVVDRLLEWLRSTGASTEVRSARQAATEQVRTGMAEVSDTLDKALDVVEPDIALTEIRGVGPANAKKLAESGVPGIASFLETTSTQEGTKRLTDKTGLSADVLNEWRAQADLTQIDGIGDSYQRALHSVGIGTMTHLANADAGRVIEQIEAIDRPGMPKQAPTTSELRSWIKEAGRMSIADAS